jgi:DNA-binding transcriptional ArsR family regulator
MLFAVSLFRREAALVAACESADYLFLQQITGLTGGNLSSHLSKLEEVVLLRIEKQFVNKRPNTQIVITDKGRNAIE